MTKLSLALTSTITNKQPQASAPASAGTVPTPRVLDTSELAAATGGASPGTIVGSRAGTVITR